MNRTKMVRGTNHKMKMIPPAEVIHMNKDQEIVVNRIRINSRLIEIEAAQINDKEKINILRKAVMEIKSKDYKRCGSVLGATMKVEDVLNVFSNIESMPSTSFAEVK